MKSNPIVSVILVIGFSLLCGCQTDADRENEMKRVEQLGAVSADKFCKDPTLSEAKRIANRGNGTAGSLVATCYEQGVGVRLDLDEAMKWYRKAQDAGYMQAANQIEHLKACIGAKDPAERGDKKQASVLADCFKSGEGGPKDMVESRKWDLIAGSENGRIRPWYQLTPEQEAEARKRFAAWRPK